MLQKSEQAPRSVVKDIKALHKDIPATTSVFCRISFLSHKKGEIGQLAYYGSCRVSSHTLGVLLFFLFRMSIHPFIRTYDSLFPVTDYESLAFFLDAFRSIPRMASCKGLCFGHHFRPFSCSDTHFIDTFLGSTQEHDTMVFLEASLVSIRRSYMAFNLNGR